MIPDLGFKNHFTYNLKQQHALVKGHMSCEQLANATKSIGVEFDCFATFHFYFMNFSAVEIHPRFHAMIEIIAMY